MAIDRDPQIPLMAKSLLFGVYWCAYCNRNGMNLSDPDGDYWCYDHVMPLGHGGTDELWNIVKACWSCNSLKWGSLWEPMPGSLTASGENYRWWRDDATDLLESLSDYVRGIIHVLDASEMGRIFRWRSAGRDNDPDIVRWHSDEEMSPE